MSTSEREPQVGLPEKRLRERHDLMMARARASPGCGFPEMMVTHAELQALYRFCNNRRVTFQGQLAPHFSSTAKDCLSLVRPLIVHDSSWFTFGGDSVREDLGRVASGKRHEGFLGHFSLALKDSLSRTPLGLLELTTFTFTDPPVPSGQARPKGASRKSRRWVESIRSSAARLDAKVNPLHVMDREADDYDLFVEAQRDPFAYVVRLRFDRKVRLVSGDAEDLENEELPALREALEGISFQEPYEVKLSRRTGKAAKKSSQPERETRKTQLQIRAASVEVQRPAKRSVKEYPEKSVRVNVVQVREVEPPAGEEPVEWLLVTNEPIETEAQVKEVVKAYRARWTIEEYFKALKTGCAYEKRELESLHGLENALGLLAPVAVELLKLKHLANEEPDAPATKVLSEAQVQVLRVLSKRVKLGERYTVREAMLAVAGVGGHIKYNGAPGWQVLYRGYRTLNIALLGWEAAQPM